MTDLLDSGERLGRAELEALQLERLRATLHHAYENVDFYRRSFDKAGLHPSDCRSLADLARFPFTTKADLREQYPFGMFAVDRSRVRRVHASSGTTGRPTVVGYTAHDLDVWADVVARSLRAAGGRPGQMVHVAYGYGLFTGGLGAHYGAERLGCTVVPASGGMTSRQVRLIQDFRPEIIMVTPSYMLTLLDEFERQGVDPRSTSLRTGIFGAEPWTERMRHEIEERFAIDAVDIYGLSEVMGPGVAQECVETKEGLHVWDEKCKRVRTSRDRVRNREEPRRPETSGRAGLFASPAGTRPGEHGSPSRGVFRSCPGTGDCGCDLRRRTAEP